MDELEVLEGEVLDGEEDPELIKTNKLLHMAKTFNNPATSQPGSKAKQVSAQQSKAKEVETKFEGQLPEHMMCVMCLERPKEVMIQACKHMVFCGKCEHDYALKCSEQGSKECPICRKKYVKTYRVMFS